METLSPATRLPVTQEMVQGAISFQHGEDWIQPWRLPFDEIRLFHPNLIDKARRCAGVRLRFKTDSSSISLKFTTDETEELTFDLTTGPEFLQTFEADHEKGLATFTGLSGERIYELWLPVFASIRLETLILDEGASFDVPADDRKHWVTYGSSITHCRRAHSPARAWPAIVARNLNLNLTCLGYGGNCQLETMVGCMIRDTPADLITMKLGINTTNTLSERVFQSAAIGLVKLIREKQPRVPIGIISSIYSERLDDAIIENGHNLVSMRPQLEEAVAILREYGDDRIEYFNGLDVIGPPDASCMDDGVHPEAPGIELMGRRITDLIVSQMMNKYKI